MAMKAAASSKQNRVIPKLENDSDDECKHIYGTPEIESALEYCVEEIWQTHEVEEASGTIRRDQIRRFMQDKLKSIDDAVLTNEDFEKYFKQVDTEQKNKLTRQQVKELITKVAKF